MCSLKHQILILLSALVILVGSFFVVLGWHMKERDVADAVIKAQADLATCGEIIDIKYPGSWSVRDGELYKGTIKISLNNDIVDHLSRLTGDTVTIFQGEMRVATTVRGSNGEREIGTKVSANVAKTVLQDGQTYIGEADVVGRWNQAGYIPLRAESGKVIGMFDVGISHVYEQEFFTRSLTAMAILGLTLSVLFVVLVWLFLRKRIIYPAQNNVLSIQEVATGQATQIISVSGAQEIQEMKDAFNQMVGQIQALTEELNRVRHSNLENDLPEKEIHAIVELMKDSEAVNEPTFNQTVVTGLKPEFSLDSPWYSGAEGLPKGLSQVTLDHIIQFLQITRRPLSAEEVAEGVKLTRVTVRHYLEFLEQRSVLKSELRYGTGGRPVKLFISL
ncbi:MAG: cache domain-containing protein [Desulfosporosinus sp.]|nr:cache domain-containing protein [Desulfosporosinus sp.]